MAGPGEPYTVCRPAPKCAVSPSSPGQARSAGVPRPDPHLILRHRSASASERRIQAIDKAIEGLFEANISGKITDERFTKMTANYEKEQKELLKLVADGKKKLLDAEQTKVDLRLLMKALRDYTDIRQLTPEIVNALIRRIEVHSKDKETKKVKVGIYFTAVGLFSLPTEKEMQAAMEEIRQNPQQFKLSA